MAERKTPPKNGGVSLYWGSYLRTATLCGRNGKGIGPIDKRRAIKPASPQSSGLGLARGGALRWCGTRHAGAWRTDQPHRALVASRAPATRLCILAQTIAVSISGGVSGCKVEAKP